MLLCIWQTTTFLFQLIQGLQICLWLGVLLSLLKSIGIELGTSMIYLEWHLYFKCLLYILMWLGMPMNDVMSWRILFFLVLTLRPTFFGSPEGPFFGIGHKELVCNKSKITYGKTRPLMMMVKIYFAYCSHSHICIHAKLTYSYLWFLWVSTSEKMQSSSQIKSCYSWKRKSTD